MFARHAETGYIKFTHIRKVEISSKPNVDSYSRQQQNTASNEGDIPCGLGVGHFFILRFVFGFFVFPFFDREVFVGVVVAGCFGVLVSWFRF